MQSTAQGRRRINIFLALALSVNVIFWCGSKHFFAKWQGVPPVPSENGALTMALGDREFAYRFLALQLQGLGDGGGQMASLRTYNYQKLGEWFRLLYLLNPASDHVPMAAAYYFGSISDTERIPVVIDYLSEVGQSPVGSKWRWLAHAVVLARHQMNDLQLALDLAYKLSKMEPLGEPLPSWAKQMPAFILKAKGDKDDARALIENMLLSSENFHPNEVNFMESFLTEQLGVPEAEVEALMRRRGERPPAAPPAATP
jgi:hypothetical protein